MALRCDYRRWVRWNKHRLADVSMGLLIMVFYFIISGNQSAD